MQRWSYAYRDGGIEAVRDKPRGGSEAKISSEKAEKLKARLDAGPTEADGVCTLRGKDIQRIAREELGTKVGLSSVHRTLERLGYSCLAPQSGKVRVFFMDEARFGQRGTLTRIWARIGRVRGR